MEEVYHRRGRWNWGGVGTSDLCGFLPLGADDGKITSDRISRSSKYHGPDEITLHIQRLFLPIVVVQEGKDPLPCCEL